MHDLPSSQLPAGPIAVASLRLEERDGVLFARLVTNDDVRHRSDDVVRYFSNVAELVAAVKAFTEEFGERPSS